MNEEGRPSGQARVTFESPAQAREAMKKNKDYMGERYIELALEPSTPRYLHASLINENHLQLATAAPTRSDREWTACPQRPVPTTCRRSPVRCPTSQTPTTHITTSSALARLPNIDL